MQGEQICLVTLESGNVSLKNVGSHDNRVKKVLAEQRCVIITALKRDKETSQQKHGLTKAHRKIINMSWEKMLGYVY